MKVMGGRGQRCYVFHLGFLSEVILKQRMNAAVKSLRNTASKRYLQAPCFEIGWKGVRGFAHKLRHNIGFAQGAYNPLWF
jgi:hypothetical protein